MSYDFPDGPDFNPEPQGDEYTAHEVFDCAKCGDGDALREGEECAYCGRTDDDE